jgi:prophage tail gpP-like protein
MDDKRSIKVADLKNYVSASWTIESTRNIYDALMHVEREKNMYSYNNPRDAVAVAEAALEALEAGISLEELLKSNKNVKIWYDKMIVDRAAATIVRLREAARQAKLDEKKRLEDEARAAVASKLTPEELAAFGLNKKGAKK